MTFTQDQAENIINTLLNKNVQAIAEIEKKNVKTIDDVLLRYELRKRLKEMTQNRNLILAKLMYN